MSKWNWSADAPSRDYIVVESRDGIAVYENPEGKVVILQEDGGFDDGEDSFVVFSKSSIDLIIKALEKLK